MQGFPKDEPRRLEIQESTSDEFTITLTSLSLF